MIEIEWPESATHYVADKKIFLTKADGSFHLPGDIEVGVIFTPESALISRRPPVGSICWVKHGKRGFWSKAEVIYHRPESELISAARLLSGDGDGDEIVWASDYKPILTPEQEAEKERREQISRMFSTLSVIYTESIEHACELLYDAGMRFND